MNFRNSTLLLILITTTSLSLISCAKNIDDQPLTHDCYFEQDDNTDDGFIDEKERAIMEDCFANRLTNIEDVRNNLIGEWQLIGHGEGWYPKKSQPCSYITFTDTELIFEYEDQYLDTLTIHTWEVNESQINTSLSFIHSINTTPNFDVWIGLTYFCDNYMYGDATWIDGNMYLYEKVY